MKLQLNKYAVLVYLVFYAAPFVDIFSGYLILGKYISEGGVGSPSQLLRFFIFAVALFCLCSGASARKIFGVGFFIIYLIFIECVFALFHQNSYGWAIGIVYGVKPIYLLLLYLVFSDALMRGFFTVEQFFNILCNHLFLSALLLVIPFVLGVGYRTYGEGTFGFKGFYASNNGLGLFLGIGVLLNIYRWRILRSWFSLFSVIVLVFSTIIIGSKSALLFSVIGFVFTYASIRSLSYKVISLIIVCVVFVFYFSEIWRAFLVVFDVVAYRYQSNPSLLGFIFSGRDVYLVEAIKGLNLEGFLLMRLFLGFGAYVSFRDPYSLEGGIDVLESDFSDILFAYGLLGLVFYLFLVIWVLVRSISSRSFYLGFVCALWVGHSVLAGHAVFNGMSGVIFPSLAVIIFFQSRIKRIKLVE